MLAVGHEPADKGEALEVDTVCRTAADSGSKCGTTRSTRSSSFRVSHFNVWSLRSGRMLPHPK